MCEKVGQLCLYLCPLVLPLLTALPTLGRKKTGEAPVVAAPVNVKQKHVLPSVLPLCPERPIQTCSVPHVPLVLPSSLVKTPWRSRSPYVHPCKALFKPVRLYMAARTPPRRGAAAGPLRTCWHLLWTSVVDLAW